MTQAMLNELASIIPVAFTNKQLLLEAFTHRSSVNESVVGSPRHNERLEFLGDAVLDLIVADTLISLNENLNEGEMTSHKSAIVKGDSLAVIALDNHLNNHIILGIGEERSGGRGRASNLAGLVEAIIGAVYLDSGLRSAKALVHEWFETSINRTLSTTLTENPKGTLQQLCQRNYKTVPNYTIVNRHGPDHSPEFTVDVRINGNKIGEGKGNSVSEAEKTAAEHGILRLQADQLRCQLL